MPVIKIGKVPFNIYPLAKAAKIMDDCAMDLDDGAASSVRTAAYLGEFLLEGHLQYLTALRAVFPKMKKLGLTEVGISTNLVGFFPAVAFFGKDELDPLVESLALKAAKTVPGMTNFFEVETLPNGLLLVSTLTRNYLPSGSLDYAGLDAGVGVDTDKSVALSTILGKPYGLFLDDLGGDLFESMSKKAEAVKKTTKDPYMAMVAHCLAPIYDNASESAQVLTSLGAVELRLEDADDGDSFFEPATVENNLHLKLGESLLKYFGAYPLSEDLDVVSAKYDKDAGTIAVRFSATVPSSYAVRDLGL